MPSYGPGLIEGVDWRNFKPLREWVLIKGDPRVSRTKGGIFLPDQQVAVEKTMEGTGTVLAVGNMKQIHKNTGGVDLEIGMRVCFRGFLKDASMAEFTPHEDGSPVFLIHSRDILAIVGDDVQMGAFSG